MLKTISELRQYSSCFVEPRPTMAVSRLDAGTVMPLSKESRMNKAVSCSAQN